MAQRFTTREIPAFTLRPGDVIHEGDGKRDKTTIVRYLTRYSTHATINSRTHHQGCRGIHVNGSACWEADARLRVTRETPQGIGFDEMAEIMEEWERMNVA